MATGTSERNFGRLPSHRELIFPSRQRVSLETKFPVLPCKQQTHPVPPKAYFVSGPSGCYLVTTRSGNIFYSGSGRRR